MDTSPERNTMITYPYTAADVASELGASIADVGMLVGLLSDDPKMYDRVTERLSDEGRKRIISQIRSGY